MVHKIYKEEIIGALSGLLFSNGKTIKDSLSDIRINGQDISLIVNIDRDISQSEANQIRLKIIDIISNINDIGKIGVVITGEGKRERKAGPVKKRNIPGVKKIIMVSSGKGGVGKSTVAASIAVSLMRNGKKVGVADADIYGPSIASLFTLAGQPKIIEGKMQPSISKGIAINSVGMLLEEGEALPWRGPMVTKAINQIMSGTNWGELDYLIVDMPPGTGDIHITMAENYNIDSVIIVTTPQELSVLDAGRAITTYRKLGVNILGVIENMSYLEVEGKKVRLFGQGGGKKLAENFGVLLLQEVPIDNENKFLDMDKISQNIQL